MIVTINVSWDVSAGVLTHNVLAPPAIPTPTPMFSVEMIATQFWPPGYACNQNKLTTTVKHKGVSIVLDGHDCGTLVLDITPPVMPNLYYAIMWPFSSRKITFGCGKVTMNGTIVGAAQLFWPPLPMMTCGDPVSAPTALALSNKLNSVDCGFTLMDLFIGLVSIALSMAIDFIFHKLGGGSASDIFSKRIFSRRLMAEVAKTATLSIGRTLLKEAVGKLIPLDARGWVKKGVSALAGLIPSGMRGNPTVKVAVGAAPIGQVEASYEHNPTPTASNPNPSHVGVQGDSLGWQRSTRGGGANWGTGL
jgi:hypothetical protein